MDANQEMAIEWECQKLMRRYYHHVDHYEYDEAILLFTPDVDWLGLGVKLDGRKQILEGLHGGLGAGTIRHMLTNVVVTVIDEDHATATAYNTLYSSRTFATIRSTARSTLRARRSSWNRATS